MGQHSIDLSPLLWNDFWTTLVCLSPTIGVNFGLTLGRPWTDCGQHGFRLGWILMALHVCMHWVGFLLNNWLLLAHAQAQHWLTQTRLGQKQAASADGHKNAPRTHDVNGPYVHLISAAAGDSGCFELHSSVMFLLRHLMVSCYFFYKSVMRIQVSPS